MQIMAGAEHGGAEGFFSRLVPALQHAGLHQRAIVRNRGGRTAQLADAGVDVTGLRFGGALDLFSRGRLKKMIAAYGPDIVLSWMNRAASHCPAGRGRYVHCGRLGGYYDLKYYRTCDHLIGNTPDIVNYLVGKGWPQEKAHYLPNFVDGARARPLSRKELYTPNDAAVVLALGRLHPNKGFDVLLHAIAKLPHVYLWLAGSGALAGELKSLASKLGVAPRVRFLGWRDDVPALFAAADAFVCSSRIEPLGNIIIEAWAQETPVVAAAAEGPRFLIQNEENGLLVDLENADALADAIYSALTNQDLAATIRAGGKKSFEADYTEDTVVGRYLEFFQRVAH